MLKGIQPHDTNDKASAVLAISYQDLKIGLDTGVSIARQQAILG